MVAHAGNCDCMACKYGLDEMMRWEQECLRTHGWYAHMVPNNYHTHGLPMSFDHLDIQVVLPIDPQQIHGVVVEMIGRIIKGEKFLPNLPYDKIVRNFNVMFVEAMEDGNHKVLRMILPDPEGSLDRAAMRPEYAAQYNL